MDILEKLNDTRTGKSSDEAWPYGLIWEAADEIERLRDDLKHSDEVRKSALQSLLSAENEIERLREALDGFEKTMSEATKTIKTLLNDLKIQTELKTRLEKICEKQHNILIANGIFPQENTKQ